MFDITAYMEEFTAAMRREFGERLVFVGLQGSFRRGEAKEGSDIDAVTVLDELCAMDLVRYDRAASALPERKRLCGFLSGRAELLNWERGDLFHFALDTQRVWGEETLLPALWERCDPRAALVSGASAIYHACCHNLLHEKSPEILQALFKQAAFVLRAKWFLETGQAVAKLAGLKEVLTGEDAAVFALFERAREDAPVADRFFEASQTLFGWAGGILRS